MKSERNINRKKTKQSKRNCRFCNNPQELIDFKEVELLKKFQTEKGKILPRRLTGNCMIHQKKLTEEIKKARELALIL
ncbi:MAG TPA: 30S ribosomal protein S18 [Victivallales bacterium]|nr:30S ribosomal protein S18 [Victivallales bacterium]HPO90363.1 30S ribosomal protein S18 [Victivallales bacterium]HRR28743.1 30S ribosomal protein S18 [Victivallales bacterium]HRU00438.1 30S ribosomal protein S18 [Victivallales bacterium]